MELAYWTNIGGKYFGDQPERLAATFDFFKQVRGLSSELPYYSTRMQEKYASLKAANDLAIKTSETVSKEHDHGPPTPQRIEKAKRAIEAWIWELEASPAA